jgi:hypothetical protein
MRQFPKKAARTPTTLGPTLDIADHQKESQKHKKRKEGRRKRTGENMKTFVE